MRIALNRGGTATDFQRKLEHVAFVRDFNFEGIFFYSDFAPDLNSEIEVAFSVPDATSYKRFVGRGTVVRVEKQASGAMGIAVRLAKHALESDFAEIA
jgi:hypothetical protein